MRYMLLMIETDEGYAMQTDPERAPAYWAAWSAYSKAVEEAGIFVSGAGLQRPETATTVRLRGGARQVQDGPFADSKEQLGGIFVIDVPDLETALGWAARAPLASYGAVEVRPLLARGA